MACGIANPTTRNWFGWDPANFDIHHRQGDYSHGPQHSETGNSAFITQLDYMFREIHTIFTATGRSLDWIGDVGLYNCRLPSYHSYGRAYDLTMLQWTPGPYYFDGNTTWRAERTLPSKRLYLGIWAVARRNFMTVLTYTYNTAHHDHIHVDDSVPLGPIYTPAGPHQDTFLVQLACNYLNGASLLVDGRWGPATQAAYENLMRSFRMHGCVSPRGNLAHARAFLANIAYCCARNEWAWQFPLGLCP